MLFVNLQRLAAHRNIPNLSRFLVNNGFSENITHRLVNEYSATIKMEHLEKLCLLFHCTPNDLLQWKPPSKKETLPNEPLKELIHPDAEAIMQFLKTAPIKELTAVHKKMMELP